MTVSPTAISYARASPPHPARRSALAAVAVLGTKGAEERTALELAALMTLIDMIGASAASYAGR